MEERGLSEYDPSDLMYAREIGAPKCLLL